MTASAWNGTRTLDGVEELVVHERRGRRRGCPRPGSPPAGGRGGRSARGPRARGRRRTSTPSRPAAPARCRCSRSPSRGGCAARGSAARAAARASPSASTETPDQAARQRPLESAAHRHVGRRADRRSRSGTPKRWEVPNDDVGTHLARRLEQHEREQVGSPRRPARRAACAASMTARRSRRGPLAPGYCASTPKQSPSGRPLGEVGDRRPRCRAARPASGSRRERLREDVGVDDEPVRRRLRRAPGDRHRLGRGGRLVEQRRVRESAAPSGRRPSSGSSAAPPAGPARSRAGTACRPCTRRGSRAPCAARPAACACRSSRARSSTS